MHFDSFRYVLILILVHLFDLKNVFSGFVVYFVQRTRLLQWAPLATSCNEVSTSELIPGESLFIKTLYLFFYRGVRLSSGTNSGLLTLAVCTSDDSGQSLMRYMDSCRVPGNNVLLSCIICLSRSWQRENFFFRLPIYQLRRIF